MALTLSALNLGKVYQGQPVLNDFSYRFEAGGAYAVMGPNGSGKSTLLRILALLEPPDTGVVQYLAGSVILPPGLDLRRRLALLLPNVGVFNTTVFNNVAYGLKVRGVPWEEVEVRVRRALEAVGLCHKERQRAVTLSSGETKRLGLARVLVIAPEVLLLDEPTASLDPANMELVEDIILRVKDQRKTTLIVATHDHAQVERWAGGRRLYLDRGKLLTG
ncbi:MAG: energy-coupling factor ABC transporter ATP-binding protein [Deltaproteobacteria bacterium]|nr:energy-coupling factor ABC transporter ATP-binding protein [Deltaproteobacteria bacterium]